MNLRNKTLVTTIRIILGLYLLMSALSGLYMKMTGVGAENIPEEFRSSMAVMDETGWFYMLKITELVAGLMLVFNFLPALAGIFVAPISVAILFLDVFVAPTMLMFGAPFALLNAYLGYAYWDKYKTLFSK